MKIWIGIDPGKSGAIAFLYEDGSIVFQDHNVPLQIMLDNIKLAIQNHDVQMCMIEDVHSIYGASAKSNFMFGFNTGLMHGIIRSLDLPLGQVQPKAWQKHIGVKGTIKGKAVKTAVAEIVQSLYPKITHDIYTPRGRLIDGRTDATGIVTYCKFKHP